MKAKNRGMLCRCAGILAAVMMINVFVPYAGKTYAYHDPFATQIQTDVDTTALIKKKFDLGGRGTASGYIGVSATEKYDPAKGYGIGDTKLAKDVDALGTDALSDAIHFQGGYGNLMIDLPSGVYKITVTTGNVRSATIVAEGVSQIYFMTGNNAVDSFTIPVTDGQLNIYATSGVGTEFSISTIEIEQTSTGTTTKPTIWLGGDSTVARYYNVDEGAKRGWGEYLYKYVDTDKYDIRSVAASGLRSWSFEASLFPTAEHYGKSGDILLLALGINDYIDASRDNADSPDASRYIATMTDLVRRAKAKGMKVYLVKQQAELDDSKRYPLLEKKWFSDELDAIAKAEKVSVIDMYHPWLEFLLEKTRLADQYHNDSIHPNALGADILAKIVADKLFPKKAPVTATPTPLPGTPDTRYQTEVSGGPIANPHKGYVMTVYNPDHLYYGKRSDGIGGSGNNRAWDVVSIVSDVLFWEDLNPAEGVYDWTEIDEMLAACEQAGMTYGIRIIPYTTTKGSDDNFGVEHDFVPQWVYDKGAKKTLTTYKYKDPSIQLKVPDWSDPIYIQAHKDFISALAARYDGDPRVEYMEVRAFGNMGEWHCSEFVGNDMPSAEIQKDMLKHYRSCFKKTMCCLLSSAKGEVYDYALSIGITKRNNGLIMARNEEWDLRAAYRANLPVMADNHSRYLTMLDPPSSEYLKWTPTRYRECIEIGHLSIYALDQDGDLGVAFYSAQKALIDEMCNRLGYNFTVTSAERYGNKLLVRIKNTGLASCFFNTDLCAEVTDANGNKISNFGSPIRIGKGSFHDGMENTYLFEYNGTLPSDAMICLAMYDCDNPLVSGKDPTVRFDNKNNLPNNRLKLVPIWQAPTPTGEPTKAPTKVPTGAPTKIPTGKPSGTPTKAPTGTPTKKPTGKPSGVPTKSPTGKPTGAPTKTPTGAPGKPTPTPAVPTGAPAPTNLPVPTGSPVPTGAPGTTVTPTPTPTVAPTIGDFVERLYTIALNRPSEPEGKAFWVKEIESGNRTGGDCAHFFLIEASEFLNRGLNEEDFVETLYLTFFDRASEPGGKEFWVGELKAGRLTREDVIFGFIDSTEWCNVCATYGVKSGAPHAKAEIASQNAIEFATRLYTCCLGREAEEDGLKYWSLALTNLEQTGCSAAKLFFTGEEFIGLKLKETEYVRRLYTTFMGRDPEASEVAYWVGEIKAGRQTKDSVMAFFGSSEEFTNICKQYGIDRGTL